MCILTFYPPNTSPDLDALAGGALVNPDGHGWAIHAGDRILTGRGMDPLSVITEFAETRTHHPDGPALFHSRLATHGRHDTSNCHPFPLGGDERTVFAHNGILPSHVHPLDGDPRSDTRIAAEDFLPRQPFGPLDSWTGHTRMQAWLGADKAVILTVDPAYKQPAYLLNEHRGHWIAGVWYSNLSFQDARYYQWPTSDLDDDDGCCLQCYHYTEPDQLHCPSCGHCRACDMPFPHCRCATTGTDPYSDLADLETA
ncbi:class II glutamine amidotransferase [Nocardia thailandica]|uniref:class II glutamine amidotransferase n=1 Tax=Nocardia thailandica TaxID=257275 RepID=UPI0003012BD5|nr:class II glutamine amidotransferase [Nocardia thailandica]